MDKDIEQQHPSFGLLQVSRVTSNKGVPLFGSSIQHGQTIRMTLFNAKNLRSLHYDRPFPEGQIVEVEMSPIQFSEMITSMNTGVGTPVTIRWVRGVGKIEGCPLSTKREKFEEEFQEKIANITKLAAELVVESKAILAKPTLLKADRERLNHLVFELTRQILDHIPFLAHMWNEQLDKTTLEAKGETEAFFRYLVESIGANHLLEDLEKMVLPALEGK